MKNNKRPLRASQNGYSKASFKHRSLRIWLLLSLSLLSAFSVLAQADNIEALLQEVEAKLYLQPTQAKALSEKAERLIDVQNKVAYRPWLLNLQAHIHILGSNYTEAFQKAKQAEQLAIASDNTLQMAEALRRQGLINFMLQSDADALELLTKSLTLHRQLDSKYVMNNLQAIGNLYDTNDDWSDNLISLGYELVDEAKEQSDAFYLEFGYSFVIAGLNKKGEYQGARRVFEEALDALGEPMLSLLYRGAQTEYQLGNYQDSLALTDDLLQRTKDMTPFVSFPVILHRADVLLALNRIDEAETLLLTTLDKTTEIKLGPFQQDAAVKLANLFEMQGDFELSARYHKLHTELLQESFNKKQSQQLALNRVRLEIEQKNLRIAELTSSKQFSEQSNTYKTFIIILCMCLLCVLATYSFIVARQKRELHAYSEQLRKAQSTLESSNTQLSHLARTDELTGIANRRVCNEFLEREWKRAIRAQSYLSVLLIDVDHFKLYNDTFGHDQGDECLKTIARVLRETVPPSAGLVARYGGEEFICVLVEKQLEAALRVAEDIHKHINQEAIPHKRSPTFPFVTLSIGVTSCKPGQGDSAQALISSADERLYMAKNAGRNCTRH